MELSPNFDLVEFACKCPGWCNLSHTKIHRYKTLNDIPPAERKIALRLMKLCTSVLELVRAKFGKAVTILSGYRCPRWNARCGGATRSKHMNGEAADIFIKDQNLREVYNYGVKHVLAVGGSEFYEEQRFVHFDIRPKAKPTDPPVHWEGH